MYLQEKDLNKIRAACKKHKVDKLYVYGSVLTNQFKDSSDIDFLVRFDGVQLQHYFDNYIDFKETLMKIVERHVDLLEVQTLKNPILKKSIENNRLLIYG